MNILCITSVVVFLSGLLTWATSNKKRTLYRPVDATERPDRAQDPYEVARAHRRKLTRKNMIVWGILSGLILLVSFTWTVAVMSMSK